MTDIQHHISDDLLDDYRAGSLPHAFSVVVAAHLSLCDDCRARHEARDMIGGALLEGTEAAPLGTDARARIMAALDTPPPAPVRRGLGVFPAPVMAELGGRPPRWRMLGGGIRQQICRPIAKGRCGFSTFHRARRCRNMATAGSN